MYMDSVTYKTEDKKQLDLNPTLLLDDLKPGCDQNTLSWYPEPYCKFFVKDKNESFKEIQGTFRSPKCSRSAPKGTFHNNMCSNCINIPKLNSFSKETFTESRKI